LKIGIKYCGGCNPLYNRKKFIDRIKNEIGDRYIFEDVKKESIYDFLLVVGGCTSCCVDYKNISIIKGLFCITKEIQYEEVLDAIEKINQYEKG